jgi:hypothetical protein
MGYVIVLKNERTTKESFEFTGNIIHWFSVKCKRITKSVLASEVYAIAEGVNMAVAIGTTIDRIVAKLGAPSVPIVVCMDFLSFYECLSRPVLLHRCRNHGYAPLVMLSQYVPCS